jgi:hypothetical protein
MKWRKDGELQLRKAKRSGSFAHPMTVPFAIKKEVLSVIQRQPIWVFFWFYWNLGSSLSSKPVFP